MMNLLLSRLDEQQRRWYVAVEAEKLGHGGTDYMATVTGINVNTIRKGRREIADDLATRPQDRVRLKGGGRKRVEKKSRQ
ncbi:MAG: transposase [Gammaproteobacteria bacterium]|nr:transposase [Gammaproteobacteria bacterium]